MKTETKRYKRVSYTFYSLFSPSSVKNLSLYLNNYVGTNRSSNNDANFRSKKILVKQSYLMLAWFNIVIRNKANVKSGCSFSFLPQKSSKFTMTKAPMAHKTFSQEQFVIRYKRLVITLPLGRAKPVDIPTTLLSVTDLHTNKLLIGTNLLFLSKIVFVLFSKDTSFFKLS